MNHRRYPSNSLGGHSNWFAWPRAAFGLAVVVAVRQFGRGVFQLVVGDSFSLSDYGTHSGRIDDLLGRRSISEREIPLPSVKLLLPPRCRSGDLSGPVG
jgi:hypothetical protein